ncbi:hypothetical protein [Azospirillum sp. TSO5]|uniref:hypothetical protein n=1 Tax=Azospirillum sp. TSO5 TaxID=716760 RepID=UPI000D614353|nr:hypothetical protein [Azospirillum sp. TSO5]PWC96970.1 hypothetical protein TSO5_05945 [Azospirillum sp. TSO5]
MAVSGDIAAALGGVTGALSGAVGAGGTISSTVGAVTSSASGASGVGGSIARTVSAVTSSAIGTVGQSFLFVPNIINQYLVEATYWNDDDGSEVTEYLANHDVTFDPSDTAPSQEYEGRVTAALQIRREMYSDGAIGGASLPSYGSIEIVVDDLLRDSGRLAAWRAGRWDGRSLRVLMGPEGAAYSDHVVLLNGTATGAPSGGIGGLSLPIADLQALLDKPVQTVTYPGTGGFDGGADLKDKVRPDVLGTVRAAVPVPVDTANGWYDLSYSGLSVVYDVYDGGVRIPPTASNPPEPGKVYTDLAAGRIRVATAPVYGLAVDCVGAAASGSSVAATICEWIITDRLGIDISRLDASAFAAFGAAASSAVGMYLTETTTALQVLDYLVPSVGGYYSSTRRGLLTVGRLREPAATSATDPTIALVIDDQDIEPGSLKVEPVPSPPYRWEIGYARNWTGQVNASQLDQQFISTDRRSFMLSEYRVEASVQATTQARNLLSKPLRSDTAIDQRADAAAEALRRRDLFGVPRVKVTLQMQTQPFALELNDEVWLDSEINGINRSLVIIGLDESARTSSVSLTLWG